MNQHKKTKTKQIVLGKRKTMTYWTNQKSQLKSITQLPLQEIEMNTLLQKSDSIKFQQN